MKKVKTYVLIISKKFAKSHSKSGQNTDFDALIKSKTKIHTIRENYAFWKKRFKSIQAGEAVLSVRVWTGLPYRSPQKEIFKFKAEDGIGLEKLHKTAFKYTIGDKSISDEILAHNDGLTLPDFKEWFSKSTAKTMAVIHFTNFRYSSNEKI